jgi:hypothetical protein
MKQYIVDRHTTPNTPKLEQVPTEKIPVYDDLDAAAADLANLSVGQIGATSDTGSELSAPTDTVQSGNMHAVTSNAVAQALQYKDDWEIGQVILTDKFFQGNRLKHYCDRQTNVSGGTTIFNLPETPSNILDIKIMAVDSNGNVLQDGYCDNVNGYYLRCAWIISSNTIVVNFSGWQSLDIVTMFIEYR